LAQDRISEMKHPTHTFPDLFNLPRPTERAVLLAVQIGPEYGGNAVGFP
jgi:hypothetical protein